jgi:outer membrane receptor protein involved in Fe transport
MRRLPIVVSFVVTAIASTSLCAQDTNVVGVGRVTGRIIDSTTGIGIVGVGIQVVGTTIGTNSGIEGRYSLTKVPAGPLTIQVRRIGFGAKSITGLYLNANETRELNVTMAQAVQQLAPAVVTAAAELGSVSEALDQQRNAVNIVSSIAQEQIAKSADGDAAQALQRVAGVTLQDGKFPFVRGLGDRYTTSSLNGARIPSPEPERRVVPLDLFPSGLIQSVTTSKTFTPDQSGDFSGGAVNIQTREFPAKQLLTFSTSYGFGDAVSGRALSMSPSLPGDLFAFGSGKRSLPWPLVQAGSFSQTPSQADINQMVGSFRNTWQARERTGAGNGSMGLSLGGNSPFAGHPIGYLLSATYSYSQEARKALRRAQVLPDANGNAEEVDRYDGEFGRSSVLWGGIFNASTLIGQHTMVSLNNTYNRTMDNDARVESGYSQELQTPLDIIRLRYVERSVRSSQLTVAYQPNPTHRIDIAATTSGVSRDEPDRSEIVYERAESDPTGTPRWLAAANEGAVRTFGDLSENAFEGKLDYKWSFGDSERRRSLKVGGFGRIVDRDALNRAYSLKAPSLTLAERALAPEQIFDGRFTVGDTAIFTISPLSAGGSYAASDKLAAAYAMVDFVVSRRLSLLAGARVERSAVEVTSETSVGAVDTTRPRTTDVLPSLGITYRLKESQYIRFAASQTLSRPEYRELSPVLYRDVIGGENVQGNPDLSRARVQNYDLRWEWYPTPVEVLSISLFAKRFRDPIERVYRATSGTRTVTFQNAKGADNIGIELELRKSLGTFSSALLPFTFFSNVTVMNSKIELDTARAAISNPDRAMVGQAPYAANVGLTYTAANGASATLLFNTVGERISDAGERPMEDVVERARTVFDFSLRMPIIPNVGLRFDAKNLLDSPYETKQGSVVREYYRIGRVFSLGFNWTK